MSKSIFGMSLILLQCGLLFLRGFELIGWPWPFILSPALLWAGMELPRLFYAKRFYRLGILVLLVAGQVVLFIFKFSGLEALSWPMILIPFWLSLYLASFNLPALLIALIWKKHGRS